MALSGHFLTTKGRLAVNRDFESAKFCNEAFSGSNDPVAIFCPSNMKKCNRPQTRFFAPIYKKSYSVIFSYSKHIAEKEDYNK